MDISFPEKEIPYLRERLALGLPTYTTRISDEFGKYHLNCCYTTDWGDVIAILEIKEYESDLHPFYNELTPEQQVQIEGYRCQVLKIAKVYF